MSNNYAIIMAGGQGTRFWPESVKVKPKQYLSLAGKESLLMQSLHRFGEVIVPANRYIVTVKEQKSLAEQHAQQKCGGIILEPAGRNTAPCIMLSLATLLAQGAKKDDVVAIVPADHIILNQQAFQQTINKSCQLAAQQDAIVTIGITPNFPHTGYGYIEKAQPLQNNFFQVSAFKEKPNFDLAQEYLASGRYLWNAGMFVVRIGFLLEEFARHVPQMYAHFSALQMAINDQEQLNAIYQQLEKISIDYAIMEKSAAVLVTPATFDWNDLGSWDALESVVKSQQDNVVVSAPHFYVQNAKNNIVFTPHQFVALVNVDDLIVVSTDKSIMVLPKKDAQRVKDIVNYLEAQSWGDDYL